MPEPPYKQLHLVSIHALARRATTLRRRQRFYRLVSIHALARRATIKIGTGAGSKCVSIHALARRATTIGKQNPLSRIVSIHALARRATKRCAGHDGPVFCFNPRPRTEGDTMTAKRLPLTCQFQSTPSHGGRHRRVAEMCGVEEVSIHALARRATQTSPH